MIIFIFKTVHIFGFVAWFAGLFYLVRMFVYHTEAYDMEDPKGTILREQYHVMEKRVMSIICNPAMVITWLAGLIMIFSYGWEWFKVNNWLHVKLLFLLGMTFYHFYCGKIIGNLSKGKTGFSTFGFRLFNEVPTLFLIIISALAVFKSLINYSYLAGSIIIVGILLILLTKLYKRIREASANKTKQK